jgi:hypothetical protein
MASSIDTRGHAARMMVGVAFLASGAALLGTILFGLALPLGLLLTLAAATVAATLALRSVNDDARRRIDACVSVGAVAGVLGLICYDSSKAILSFADPSPFNPFGATAIFGALLIGQGAPSWALQLAGIAFHVVNGIAFAIAYTTLFARFGATSRRRAVLQGMVWGVFLETFQLTLYPGWLDIKSYAEFATISAGAHLIYGATLGLVSRELLRRRFPPLSDQVRALMHLRDPE